MPEEKKESKPITRLIRMQYNQYVRKQTAAGKDYMSLQEFANQQ